MWTDFFLSNKTNHLADLLISSHIISHYEPLPTLHDKIDLTIPLYRIRTSSHLNYTLLYNLYTTLKIHQADTLAAAVHKYKKNSSQLRFLIIVAWPFTLLAAGLPNIKTRKLCCVPNSQKA